MSEDELEIVQQKPLSIVVCTTIVNKTGETKKKIEQMANMVGMSGVSSGYQFPNSEAWEEFVERHPDLEKGKTNEFSCEMFSETRKHYVLFV